jgi:hypothetical protein
MEFMFGTIISNPLNEGQRAKQSEPRRTQASDECVVWNVVQKVYSQVRKLRAGFGGNWPAELDQKETGCFSIGIRLFKLQAPGSFGWNRLISKPDKFSWGGGS